jgi:RNA polymerase sigma-70 factor (ECF subfamily)
MSQDRAVQLPRPRIARESEPQSDVALIERVRAGDTEAFESVFRTYWETLFLSALRMLHSRDDAEEAVQEVFARIWRGHAGWNVNGSIRAYLLMATRNVSLNRIDRDATAQRYQERAAHEVSSNSSAFDSPAERLDESDLARALSASLAELPEKRRAICELRLVDGFTYAEIAVRLRIAPKTVETQLARGLKFLRQRLRTVLE